jgi:hypothetical protein
MPHNNMLLLLLMIATLPSALGLAVEFKGWVNNCTLYFDDSVVSPRPEDSLAECHLHICSKEYLLNCDEYILLKKYTVEECMPLCCSQNSQYRPFQTVLDFLT